MGDDDRKGTRGHDARATRAALLRAAMRRFTLLGYDRTTIRDVGADAGVNPALIARYFGSKEGLFVAVLRESAAAMGGTSIDSGDLVDNVLEGLRPGGWSEFGGEHPLLMLLRDRGESPEVAALRHRSLAAAVDRLVDIAVADGRQESGNAGGFDAETVLVLMVGILSVRASVPAGSLAHLPPRRFAELVRALVDATAPQRAVVPLT